MCKTKENRCAHVFSKCTKNNTEATPNFENISNIKSHLRCFHRISHTVLMVQRMPFINFTDTEKNRNDSCIIKLLNLVLVTTNKPLIISNYITAVFKLALLFTVSEGNPCWQTSSTPWLGVFFSL